MGDVILMQRHQNPNQTKNLNGVLGLLNYWLSQVSKPKKKKSRLDWLMGLLNFWFDLVGLVG